MVKYSTLLFLLVLINHCLSNTATSQEIRVMTWNILHGGQNETLPKDGRPIIIDVIKESGADIILMIETYGSAPMIAKALGFNYELLSSNLCVFSRFPITKKLLFANQIDPFNFGGVEISVEGKPLILFDTWLHYLPDTRLVPLEKSEDEILAWEHEGSRDEEIQAILKAISPYIENAGNVPIVMGGDFNSHSHLDWTEDTRNLFNHGNAVVAWGISTAMRNVGFVDTFREAHPNTTKNLGTTWNAVRDAEDNLTFTREDRIDYIYSMGDKLHVDASISFIAPLGHSFSFNGKGYPFFPSDHGFVLTTFQLN